MINYVAYLEKKFNRGTPDTYKAIMKIFYKWFYSNYMRWKPLHERDFPELVAWMKIRTNNGHKKLPEELLTQEDVKKLVEYTHSFRNKALIMLLYDGALRISEALDIKLKHLVFDDYGGCVIVDGKTGMRKLRLIDSIPYLKEYINKEYPFKDDPDKNLFVVIEGIGVKKDAIGHRLDDRGVRIAFNRIKARAGIKKKVNPHLFRHSRLTELAKYLTEQELKIFAGWTAGSNMAQVYIHLSGKDVEDKILEHNGLKKTKDMQVKDTLKPKRCIDPSCNHLNPSTNKFCSKCHRPIEIKEIMQIEEEQLIFNKVKEKAILEKLDINEILDEIIETKLKNR